MATIKTKASPITRRQPGAVQYIAMGLAMWTTAIIAFRLAGQYFFAPGSWQMAASFGVLALMVVGLLPLLLGRYQLDQAERLRAVALLLLGNMLGDIPTLIFYDTILSNMPGSTAGACGALVIMSYGLALIVGMWPVRS